MIAVLLVAAQAGPPPLLVLPTQTIHAVAWKCDASGAAIKELNLSGVLPAISVEAQKSKKLVNLRATVSSSNDSFKGTYEAALTGSQNEMNRYSIYLPGPREGYRNIIMLTLYPRTSSGFVNVLGYENAFWPRAFASGTCELQVVK